MPTNTNPIGMEIDESYDCPNDSEITLKDLGKPITWIAVNWWYHHNKTKHHEIMCNSYGIVWSPNPLLRTYRKKNEWPYQGTIPDSQPVNHSEQKSD